MRRAPVRVAVAAVIALLAGLVGVVVTASTASATYPGADGRIAFVRHGQIYTVRPDGSGLRQLTTSGTNSHPKWGPQGHRIAFVHEAAGGATDLWVMGARGLRKKQVTHVGNATEPTWSPDGQYLAFGGGDLSTLEKVSSKAPFGSPTDLLAYETGKCCGDELPADAHPLNVDRFVAWSPDGTRIAVYNHDDDQLDDAIYMYDLASGEAAQYASIGGSCCGAADWVDLVWGPTGDFGYASTDHTEETLPSTIVYPGYAGKAGDTAPSPDPAGTKLALTNGARMVVQDINGADRRFLAWGQQPDWQPRV
jgi:Tol biopolymer transport system component